MAFKDTIKEYFLETGTLNKKRIKKIVLAVPFWVILAAVILIAAGFIGCQDYIADAFGVPRGPRGTVQTEADHYQTGQDGVFTAGDMHRGQSLVVWAITEGRECAKEVDYYLMGYSNM